MIKITQFGGRMQSVTIGTEPVMDKANAGDPLYRCMIGGHRSTPHTLATLMVMADLRSGHWSIEITSPVRIPKHERERERQKRRSPAPISKDHTNPGADPKNLGYWTFRKLKQSLIWAFNPFDINLN
jgi:hypothetical protein